MKKMIIMLVLAITANSFIFSQFTVGHSNSLSLMTFGRFDDSR